MKKIIRQYIGSTGSGDGYGYDYGHGYSYGYTFKDPALYKSIILFAWCDGDT